MVTRKSSAESVLILVLVLIRHRNAMNYRGLPIKSVPFGSEPFLEYSGNKKGSDPCHENIDTHPFCTVLYRSNPATSSAGRRVEHVGFGRIWSGWRRIGRQSSADPADSGCQMVVRPRASTAPLFSGASGAFRATSKEKSAGKQQPAGADAPGLAVTETPTGAVHMLGLADPGAEAGLELGGQA